MMWVALAMLVCVAISPFIFAAHHAYTGWAWRRRMMKEWEEDVQSRRMLNDCIPHINSDGETLH